MDLIRSHFYIHDSASSSSQAPSSVAISHSSISFTNFPIIAIAVIGILATAFLLVTYYIIVIKCCLNIHRLSFLRTQEGEDPLTMQSPRTQLPKGLDQAVINAIPIVEFKNEKCTESLEQSFQECPVCLAEFQANEKLRCLQGCSHLFHMDCIDVWLQNNENCPLCRTSICYSVPSASPLRQDLTTAETTTCVENDFVVIEIQQQQQPQQQQQQQDPTRHHFQKLELRDTAKKGRKKQHQQLLSMGDECIDVRVKDDLFTTQPIRRSISMDSSNDRQLYLMVQDALQRQQQQKNHCNRNVVSSSVDQGCSSSSFSSSNRFLKRSFFSFGSGRADGKGAVLPIQ